MTLILKLIGYWLNLEQVHHRPRKLIQIRWLILLKHIHLFVMSGDFSFQDQMDYIFINQPVRQFLGSTVHTRDFTLSLRLYIPLIAIKWFSKKCFTVLMLFVFLTLICTHTLFLSNLFTLSLTLNLYLYCTVTYSEKSLSDRMYWDARKRFSLFNHVLLMDLNRSSRRLGVTRLFFLPWLMSKTHSITILFHYNDHHVTLEPLKLGLLDQPLNTSPQYLIPSIVWLWH